MALAAFRRLFQLSGVEDEFLAQLRRQSSGTQFGHDLSFRAPSLDGAVCHVECKNYTRRITTDDIAGKLLQQRSASAAGRTVDHWVLISPHTDPSNELEELRQYQESDDWDSVSKYGVLRPAYAASSRWSPSVYNRIYGEPVGRVDEQLVLREFKRRLAPRIRLPRPFRDYLRDPWRMCFSNEDSSHFEYLRRDFIPLQSMDLSGVESGPLGRGSKGTEKTGRGWPRQPRRA